MLLNLFLLLIVKNIVCCNNEESLNISSKGLTIKDHNIKSFLNRNNKGKQYAAIYFTSSNCPSCKKINKTLEGRITNIKKKHNIVFYVCAYCNTFEEEQQYLKKFLSFIHVNKEERKKIKEQLQVNAVPTMFLIDLNNFVIISNNILPNILKGTISKVLV
jgi:thiol-disulfide isomerase/thioredoxin